MSHPAFERIRMAVFLSAATTLFGFGAMWVADHSVLKSTGTTAFLGVAYSMIGAFLILPPVLGYIEKRRKAQRKFSESICARVRHRYRGMEAYPRLFARFKMKFDPMFEELPQIFQCTNGVATILDIGCGYGVPACWLLERFPHATLYGIEPSAERVRIAAIAVGERGRIQRGCAPELPAAGRPADLSTMIDMIHYLPDSALAATLEGLRGRMRSGGRLAVRAPILPNRRFPWAWWLENAILRASRMPVYYRPPDRVRKLIEQAGFLTEEPFSSGKDEELVWFLGTNG
jgi:SAM-dependent methyltransferase